MSTTTPPAPPAMPETLELEAEFLERLDAQIAELQPAVEKHSRLMDFRNRLTGASRTPSGRGRTTRSSSSGSTTQAASSNGGGRGKRMQQFLEVVQANPGVRVADAARMMGLENPAYAYKLLKQATEAGTMRQDDEHGLFAMDGAASS